MGTTPTPDPGYIPPPPHPPGNGPHHPPGDYVPAGEASGLAPNIAGALCYITIIPAIIFLALAPYNRDRFIRFHAWQSLIFGIIVFIIDIGLMFIPFMGWIIRDLFSLLFFILWVIAILKAFQGQEWKIPIVGDMAAQQASKGVV